MRFTVLEKLEQLVQRATLDWDQLHSMMIFKMSSDDLHKLRKQGWALCESYRNSKVDMIQKENTMTTYTLKTREEIKQKEKLIPGDLCIITNKNLTSCGRICLITNVQGSDSEYTYSAEQYFVLSVDNSKDRMVAMVGRRDIEPWYGTVTIESSEVKKES